MRKVQFVISSLDYHGSAKQLLLLTTTLAQQESGIQPHVCVLKEKSPWGEVLDVHDIPTTFLDWKRPFDVRPFIRLREAVRDTGAGVFHIWGLTALRAVALSVGLGKQGLVLSGVFSSPSVNGFFGSATAAGVRGRKSLSFIDRWLLQRVKYLTISGETEAELLRRNRVPEDRLARILPGVVTDSLPTPSPPATSFREQIGCSSTAPLIVCSGPLERYKNLKDAVWAVDLLSYLYPDMKLVLVGEGSDFQRLARLREATTKLDNIHFLGRVAGMSSLMSASDLVWVVDRGYTGINTALEAMAAGKPVIASQASGAADVVVDGETGFLIKAGDPIALAKKTRFLLEDHALRQRMGEAGRKLAGEKYTVEGMAARFAHLYGMVDPAVT